MPERYITTVGPGTMDSFENLYNTIRHVLNVEMEVAAGREGYHMQSGGFVAAIVRVHARGTRLDENVRRIKDALASARFSSTDWATMEEAGQAWS